MVQAESATTGHPASVPTFVVGDAAQVARDAYEACVRGDAVQVSGLVNQVATYWMQHQPRWLGRAIGSWIRQWGA
jgi:hypothetical protein